MADINKELSPDISGVEEPTSIIPDVESVEGREPAYVYGYYSLVDPETGEKHYIMNYDLVPPDQLGHPEYFAVVFRAVGGKETRRVEFRASFGYKVSRHPTDPNQVEIGDPDLPGVACLYYYPLIQDRSEADRDPRIITDYYRIRLDGVGSVIQSIRYNPDRWRFATVEVGPYDLPDPDGSLGGPDAERYQDHRGDWRSRIRLTRRAEPFPDLADMPPWEWTEPRS